MAYQMNKQWRKARGIVHVGSQTCLLYCTVNTTMITASRRLVGSCMLGSAGPFRWSELGTNYVDGVRDASLGRADETR
jgi:hypothetical protein